MRASDILVRVQALWLSTRAKYRDGMVEVGRLLHEFVAARLAEGDARNESERRRAGQFRGAVVAEAARALSTSPARVNELIRVAMVADTLFAGRGLGALSYASLRRMRVLIHRPAKGKPARRGKKAAAEGEVRPSEKEAWAVRPGLEETARETAARAAAEGWTEAQVRRAVGKLEPEVRRHVAERHLAVNYRPVESPAVESADDAVAAVVSLAMAADDPESVLAEALARVRLGAGVLAERRARLERYLAAAEAESPVPYEGASRG